MTTSIQSAVTVIRKHVGVKGSSVNNGRGCYHCKVDVTWEQLMERFAIVYPSWEHEQLVEQCEHHADGSYSILLSSAKFNSYRRIFLNKRAFADYGSYQVCFVEDDVRWMKQ